VSNKFVLLVALYAPEVVVPMGDKVDEMVACKGGRKPEPRMTGFDERLGYCGGDGNMSCKYHED
jgi:hypothetical protein